MGAKARPKDDDAGMPGAGPGRVAEPVSNRVGATKEGGADGLALGLSSSSSESMSANFAYESVHAPFMLMKKWSMILNLVLSTILIAFLLPAARAKWAKGRVVLKSKTVIIQRTIR